MNKRNAGPVQAQVPIRNWVAKHEKENARTGAGLHRNRKRSYQEREDQRELKEYLNGFR